MHYENQTILVPEHSYLFWPICLGFGRWLKCIHNFQSFTVKLYMVLIDFAGCILWDSVWTTEFYSCQETTLAVIFYVAIYHLHRRVANWSDFHKVIRMVINFSKHQCSWLFTTGIKTAEPFYVWIPAELCSYVTPHINQNPIYCITLLTVVYKQGKVLRFQHSDFKLVHSLVFALVLYNRYSLWMVCII